MSTNNNGIADAYVNPAYQTIDGLAGKIGVGKQRARELMQLSISKGITVNESIKRGTSVLFTNSMIQKVIEAYNSGQLGEPRKRSMNAKTDVSKAHIVITVPVFDKTRAELIKAYFGSIEKATQFLNRKLDEHLEPVMNNLVALEKEFEQKRRMAMQKSLTNTEK